MYSLVRDNSFLLKIESLSIMIFPHNIIFPFIKIKYKRKNHKYKLFKTNKPHYKELILYKFNFIITPRFYNLDLHQKHIRASRTAYSEKPHKSSNHHTTNGTLLMSRTELDPSRAALLK